MVADITTDTDLAAVNGDHLTQRFESARLEDLTCVRCGDGFNLNEQIVNSGGQVWHAECFVYVYLMFLKISVLIKP